MAVHCAAENNVMHMLCRFQQVSFKYFATISPLFRRSKEGNPDIVLAQSISVCSLA